MDHVIVVIGSGQIGQAIARRVGMGHKILLADVRQENADAAALIFQNAGYDVQTAVVDVSARASVQALAKHASRRRPCHRLAVRSPSGCSHP
jgi:NAD(P)-dependent dehydrogenase (short-subunit alcohol dehydrogenase family)